MLSIQKLLNFLGDEANGYRCCYKKIQKRSWYDAGGDLNAVDDEAQERMGILVRQMMEKQGVTEELKARDQMVWVGVVNNIRNAAEEIVLKELIYRQQNKS